MEHTHECPAKDHSYHTCAEVRVAWEDWKTKYSSAFSSYKGQLEKVRLLELSNRGSTMNHDEIQRIEKEAQETWERMVVENAKLRAEVEDFKRKWIASQKAYFDTFDKLEDALLQNRELQGEVHQATVDMGNAELHSGALRELLHHEVRGCHPCGSDCVPGVVAACSGCDTRYKAVHSVLADQEKRKHEVAGG